MIQFYLAGPYTGATEAEVYRNVVTALRAAAKITEIRGWWPIVPHVSGPHCASGEHDGSWKEAMDRCLLTVHRLTPHQDKLVLLPNWMASRGSRLEESTARILGIDVWTLKDALDLAVIDAEEGEDA